MGMWEIKTQIVCHSEVYELKIEYVFRNGEKLTYCELLISYNDHL